MSRAFGQTRQISRPTLRSNATAENQVPGKLITNENLAKAGISNIQRPRRALIPSSNVVANKPLATRQPLAKKSSSTSLGKEKVIDCLGDKLDKKGSYDLKPPTPRKESIAFSEFILPADVEDIDANDGTNVLLASEYVTDIYNYLRQLERKQPIRRNFLSEQRILTAKMRALLVDWLVNVHSQFKLLPETLYMGISIMDRFFQYESVSKDKFQLIGVTAFFIASKFEEIIPPDLTDWVVICDQLYTKRDILKMEMVILRRLKFELGRPLPIHFLRRNSKAAHADPKIHTLAKYLMELSLVDANCSSWAPSLLAAVALYITLKVLHDGESGGNWTPTLAFYSAYSEQQMQPFACYLCKVLQRAPNGRYLNVYKKYCSSKQLEIAKLPELNCAFVEHMAARAPEPAAK